MRLSRFTDLGLRSLMYLGHRGDLASSIEIVNAYGVSRDHVLKGLQSLAALGVVRSVPGRNGGFALDRDPDEVRLGALVRALEPSLEMAECFGPDSRCPLTPSCDLSRALRRAQASFFDTLDEVTLADLLRGTQDQLVVLERSVEYAS